VRITGGAARAYYLGVDTAEVTPGQRTVLCLTPRGFEEGEEVTLGEHALELLTNRPVRFRLFSSSDRLGDHADQLLTLPADALAGAAEAAGELAAAKIEAAVELLRALYSGRAGDDVAPAGVMKKLQEVLGPKDGWSFTTLRALWEPLKELRGGRGKSPAHE